MSVPLISVIIPTYNRRHLLKTALDSIYAQTVKDYEVIIVDDGSEDNTDEFIKSYPQVRYVKIPNGGPSKARNTGIRMSKGKYIAFFDSDDYWDHDKLELQLEEFKKNSDIVMVYTNYRNIDDKNNVIKDRVVNAPTNDIAIDSSLQAIIEGTLTCFTSTVMLRRSILEETGLFDESYKMAEDFDLWIRVGLLGKIRFITRPTISLRLHENHLSRTLRSEVWRSFLSVTQKHVRKLSKKGLLPSKYIAKFSLLTANALLREKHRFLSFKYCVYAMYYDPLNSSSYKGIIKCVLPAQVFKRETFGNDAEHKILKEYY